MAVPTEFERAWWALPKVNLGLHQAKKQMPHPGTHCRCT